MTDHYWLTICIPASEDAQAQAIAEGIAQDYDGRIVDVCPEPPQGSTIVGDMHEDGP